ncbi:COG3650 family protein [Pseudomonas aeruginosa]
MRPARLLVYSLLPLFAACQVWKPESPSTSVDTRFQGELVKINGALQFRPCTEKRLFSIEDVANTGLRREADSLFDDGAQGLFVDLRGTMGPAKVRGTDGKLEVSRLYRMQNEGPGCDDPNFKLLTFAANGNEPFWSARVNNQGLRLDRPEHETLALPYVAEELPNGSTSYSSEANGKKVELWIAPSSCTDSMSGAFSSYSAELRIDGETLRGCAYPGALGK